LPADRVPVLGRTVHPKNSGALTVKPRETPEMEVVVHRVFLRVQKVPVDIDHRFFD